MVVPRAVDANHTIVRQMNKDVRPARSCGPCTFCCKVMSIEELGKPVGSWCGHCKPGVGCSIYGQHPKSCQDFSCQWLLDGDLPHRFRPDQSKVVLATADDGTRLVAHCDPANPMAWKRAPMHDLLREQARATWMTGLSVVAKAGNRLWVIGLDRDVDLGEVHPRAPLSIVQGRMGELEVKVLPPIADGGDVSAALTELRSELEN